ncbi:MAG TPA: pseudouridine synthase [Kofleriaceae bacterium]|jgi:tRNA pseudouridine65 synthase|nr:pseudouridine synthase [Kofleriaceae bacterium]
MTPRIVWRDDRFAVIDKPAGVAVHRGWAAGGDDDVPLVQQVRDLVGARVWLVHRLDRGASGAVLFALDAEAAAGANAAFAAGTVDKRYLAITRGHPPEHAVIDHAIPREPGGERVPAVTEIWRRDTFGRYALVEAHPRTGRLHQIRRHLKHISCPLIGDVRYGKGEHNRIFRTHHGLHRLALHAIHLGLAHPFGGPPIAVDVALAADLVGAIASARAASNSPA